LDGHALIDRPRAFHITIIPITLYNMFF
jgi:hypothetical protein